MEQTTENIVVWGGVAIVAVLSYWAANKAALKGRKVALRVAAIVWVIFTASIFIWLWNAHGYDGLVPIYLLIIVSTPSLVFGVIGALFGVSKRRQIDENDPT